MTTNSQKEPRNLSRPKTGSVSLALMCNAHLPDYIIKDTCCYYIIITA